MGLRAQPWFYLFACPLQEVWGEPQIPEGICLHHTEVGIMSCGLSGDALPSSAQLRIFFQQQAFSTLFAQQRGDVEEVCPVPSHLPVYTHAGEFTISPHVGQKELDKIPVKQTKVLTLTLLGDGSGTQSQRTWGK